MGGTIEEQNKVWRGWWRADMLIEAKKSEKGTKGGDEESSEEGQEG